MGRKIPGKKHRGVKYPHQQAAERHAKIADQINHTPSFPDKQEIPKSVMRIMQFKGKLKKKKPKEIGGKQTNPKLISTADFMYKEYEQPGMTRPVKPPAVVTQLPGERMFHFMQRVNQTCMRSMREAMFEDEFNVEVKRDPETGAVINVQKEQRNEVHEIIAKAEESRKKRKMRRNGTLSKSERRRAKLVAKAEVKNEREKGPDFSDYKDEVKFGELVHRPPEINIRPKTKNKVISAKGKPGCKNLLLKSMLEGQSNKQRTLLGSKEKKQLPETVAQKKVLEAERQRVVELYRSMKSKNKIT